MLDMPNISLLQGVQVITLLLGITSTCFASKLAYEFFNTGNALGKAIFILLVEKVGVAVVSTMFAVYSFIEPTSPMPQEWATGLRLLLFIITIITSVNLYLVYNKVTK